MKRQNWSQRQIYHYIESGHYDSADMLQTASWPTAVQYVFLAYAASHNENPAVQTT